jgi:hypothetical protein
VALQVTSSNIEFARTFVAHTYRKVRTVYLTSTPLTPHILRRHQADNWSSHIHYCYLVCYMMDLDPNLQSTLLTLRRQYLQLVEPAQMRWPDAHTLKAPHVQSWIYHQLFRAENIPSPPPPPYQQRVLKLLISKIESAFEDPEQDVCLAFSSLLQANKCILAHLPWHIHHFDFSTTTLTIRCAGENRKSQMILWTHCPHY